MLPWQRKLPFELNRGPLELKRMRIGLKKGRWGDSEDIVLPWRQRWNPGGLGETAGGRASGASPLEAARG
jgi:hypothetical protein